MNDNRLYRLPFWWRPCEEALKNLRKNEKQIRIIEEAYLQPGSSLKEICIQGSSTNDFIAITIDRMAADSYLARLKHEKKAIEATNRIMISAYGLQGGNDRLRLIEMLYVKATHSMIGVSEALNVTERTACRYRSQYMWCLAKYLGYEPVVEDV
jgi:hypothetical protein